MKGLALGGDCKKVILNTKGANNDEVEQTLIDFLRYVERGLKAIILDNLEENKTEEQMIEKLIRRFSLSPEAARRYYNQFDWMEDI